MNSTFRARWLASSEVISQVLFTSEQPKKNIMAFLGILSQIKLLFSNSACVVHTKTIIHLSVGQSSGYLFPLRVIIVNYSRLSITLGDYYQALPFIASIPLLLKSPLAMQIDRIFRKYFIPFRDLAKVYPCKCFLFLILWKKLIKSA